MSLRKKGVVVKLLQLDLLVVEDDPTLSEVLAMHLEAAGWNVRRADDAAGALRACEERLPQLALLDVMLPGRTGLELCLELRLRYGATPGIVMLTALGSESDIVCGLESGADDYIVKPLRPREILARVASLARRIQPIPVPAQETTIVIGELHIHPAIQSIEVRGRTVNLTVTETQLLCVLASEPKRTFPRAELLERVFDSKHVGYARNVDCHITRLRKKLEDAGLDRDPITTVHGVGYRLC